MSKETISAVNVKTLTTTALLAAVLCILGPLSIPIGPVPISLTSLALYFMVFLVGPKMSAAACAIYILIGFAGLPVFSGFTGGPQKLAGPTGGYIIGFEKDGCDRRRKTFSSASWLVSSERSSSTRWARHGSRRAQA